MFPMLLYMVVARGSYRSLGGVTPRSRSGVENEAEMIESYQSYSNMADNTKYLFKAERVVSKIGREWLNEL